MINDDKCKSLGNRKFLLYNPGFLTTCGPWDGHPRVRMSCSQLDLNAFSIAVSGQDAPELHGTVIFPADLFHSLKHTSARDTVTVRDLLIRRPSLLWMVQINSWIHRHACMQTQETYVRNHLIGFKILKSPLPSATQNITGITSDFRFFGFHLTKDNTNSLGKLVTYQKK